ncbi:MAG: hypothetical protein PVG71_10590, partial [Anaerolineae bacterium]
MIERREGEVWTVDADVTLQSLVDDIGCPEPLRRALTGIYSWQVRNEITVRRALKASQRMSQWLAVLLGLGAAVTIEGEDGPEGRPEPVEREVPLEDLLEHGTTGQVAALHIPTWRSHDRWGEAHVGRSPAD